MKGKKDNKNEETKKYLYAEPKFMIPPDPLKLPEPFSKITKKEEQGKKNWLCTSIIISWYVGEIKWVNEKWVFHFLGLAFGGLKPAFIVDTSVLLCWLVRYIVLLKVLAFWPVFSSLSFAFSRLFLLTLPASSSKSSLILICSSKTSFICLGYISWWMEIGWRYSSS